MMNYIYGIVAFVLANYTVLLPAMFALTFRKKILLMWKVGVRILCSALVTVASVLYVVCGSLLTVLYTAGAAGGEYLGEVAVEYLNPTVLFLLLSFATSLILLVDFFTVRDLPQRFGRFLFRPSPVVLYLRDFVDAFSKPRFFLLQ